jgi:cation:H+ antiporter
VGIVIIGLGTSLPELAVSIGAALKRSPGMTVGNIIGSNIFDGLIPVGLGGVISTVSMDKDLLKFDLPFLFATTILVLIFLASQRGISKAEGLILAGVYILYIAVKIQLL